MCCGRASFVLSVFCSSRNKDWLHHSTVNTVWLPAGRIVLIKLAGYLCLALLKQRWTFSLRSVIICSINKDIALPFWKGQVQHFLRCWANLQSKKGQKRNMGCTTRNGMSAWLCDQVKTGEMAINTVMWWWAVLALQISRRWITSIAQNRRMELFSEFKLHNASISML